MFEDTWHAAMRKCYQNNGVLATQKNVIGTQFALLLVVFTLQKGV